jgi:hypothetical protein
MPCILNVTDFEGKGPADRFSGSTPVFSDTNNTENLILGQRDIIESW